MRLACLPDYEKTTHACPLRGNTKLIRYSIFEIFLRRVIKKNDGRSDNPRRRFAAFWWSSYFFFYFGRIVFDNGRKKINYYTSMGQLKGISRVLVQSSNLKNPSTITKLFLIDLIMLYASEFSNTRSRYCSVIRYTIIIISLF